MFSTTGRPSREVCLVASLLNRDAPGLGVPHQARVSQVVQFRVVHNVPEKIGFARLQISCNLLRLTMGKLDEFYDFIVSRD